MLDAGTSASLVPVRYPRGRVRRPRWTPRSDSLPDTAYPVASGRTPSTPPGTPPEPEATRPSLTQGTDERHGRHSDIPDRTTMNGGAIPSSCLVSEVCRRRVKTDP